MRRPLSLYVLLSLALVVAVVAAPDPLALVKQLGSPSTEQRAAAARQLEALGPAAVPALTVAADSDDAEIRTRSRAILALSGDDAARETRLRRAAEAVSNALRAPRGLDEGSAFDDAIAEFAPESSRLLARAVRDRAAYELIDRRTAGALARHPVEETWLVLAELIRDERLQPSAGLAAARAIAELRDAAREELPAPTPSTSPALAALSEAMSSRHDATRRMAVAMFGAIASPADVASIGTAEDRSTGVRAETARVMGLRAPSESAAALRRLARDADAGVREAALLALCRVPGTPHPEAAVAASSDASAAVRAAAARLLGREATPETMPVLEGLALDGSVRVRAAARRALAALRG